MTNCMMAMLASVASNKRFQFDYRKNAILVI